MKTLVGLLLLLTAYQSYAATTDYYTAAVVEYGSPTYPSFSADEVMLANAAVFTDFMRNASLSEVDIIVFPEGGLSGHNVRKSIELPSPEEKANPCTESTKYHTALVLLSCAAKKYNMYAVINTGEQYYSSTTNKTEYYNSNVAIDKNGTVVARYRKFNPYGEPVTKPALDLHTFTTDFNVTFGMFICFDIDFEEPGVVLARDYGVKHFAFPHCWISELPFLTAIQAQWGFAYSLDTVLLASGCNYPSSGGTGSGIYHGRRGALQYFQTNSRTSRLLIANVSKNFEPDNKVFHTKDPARPTTYKEPVKNVVSNEFSDVEVHLLEDQHTNSSLFLLRDYTDVYRSRQLFPSGFYPSSASAAPLQDSSLTVTLTTKTTICQGVVCCDFEVRVTSIFNATKPSAPSRGDDFSRQFYRLVAFDGVRWYGGGVATGGVQLCGVVSCVNDSISSCGLRSDDASAQVATYGQLFKTETRFESVTIIGTFTHNRTFIYPDILTTATGDNFGALVPSAAFAYEEYPPYNGSIMAYLKINYPIDNLVTAAIYARQFDRDGQKRTELPLSSYAHPLPGSIFLLGVFFLLFFNCILSTVH
ncbi:vanin-like protein 1 [Macrosteles quadrilineatus]|uniref:vanin-like protein 1 n=1 Tax=Macrosteles quadrilineatus TaxID=74068 RepID=UPI0023E0E90C|nr:vanin-like protein 1 [Macrosteles quadrilineatus]